MTDSTQSPSATACRTALVTGGTSGLGLAMAAALAGAGLRVAVVGRSAERAETAAAELPGAFGVGLDVRDEGSVSRAVQTAWSRLDGIDLLVNNAGIGMRTVNQRFMTEPRGFWTVPDGAGSEALSRVMAVDLRDTPVTVNVLLPGGATRTGMLPDEAAGRPDLLESEIMGPPIVWLASAEASGVRDQRIVAAEFTVPG
jgi:NAD(P)-dependent dehydrogenase (short-subunit alcohol dehydrogenase family)